MCLRVARTDVGLAAKGPWLDDNQTRVGGDYRGRTSARHGSGAFTPVALGAGEGMMRHQRRTHCDRLDSGVGSS